MFYYMINFIVIKLSWDIPEPSQLGLQDSGNLCSEGLMSFHDNIMFYVIMILVLVGWLLISSNLNKYFNSFLIENNTMEVVWTMTPALILVLMALPSLHLLYLMDENLDPSLVIKALGHQWYWSYEYSNFEPVMEFDSYMTLSSELESGGFSLLEVDNSLFVPMGSEVKLMITSTDVIHSWAVPSLGCKVDAIPGSLNQMSFMMNSPGKFYGQCSELCGANHSFMPMNINSVSKEKFMEWCSTLS